jgi:hypothetical protein
MKPYLTDNDKGNISVTLNGLELRGWIYANDEERRQKMIQAREYIEGWCDGRDSVQMKIVRSDRVADPPHHALIEASSASGTAAKVILD